jgi:biopolymer transport protein ExbB
MLFFYRTLNPHPEGKKACAHPRTDETASGLSMGTWQVGLHLGRGCVHFRPLTLLMKAIATLAALFCSVVITFAQEGSGKSGAPSRPASAGPVTQLDAGRGAAQASSPMAPASAATATATADATVENLWELIEKGGWAMIPLGALSVIAVMLVIGFTLTIRRGMVVSKQYVGTVEVLIRKRDYLGVLAVSNRHNESLARVVQKALDFATKNPGVPFESLKEVAEAEGSAQASSLQHRVAYLADIGILAPMVGLFGTVIGIIRSFAAIGKGNASLSRDILLASGVSEALIATATGLVLAVVSAGFYAIFRNRVQKLISELEGASSHIMGLLAASYQKRREPGRIEDEF